MSARCASCKYPLTISDSIVCFECNSCFHIDCAQLAGFPYYELSGDPNRNTFRCSTCEILPLPSTQCFGDSDSDSEHETMPSRQLDYQLEGQTDLTKDMNEIRGSVQDISDLCKDMMREINDLKSINLTLRCCVENLRHDNEERDKVIADLRWRLEAFETNKNHGSKPKEFVNRRGRLNVDQDDDAGSLYMTPERECPKTEDFEKVAIEYFGDESSSPQHEAEDLQAQVGLSECTLLVKDETVGYESEEEKLTLENNLKDLETSREDVKSERFDEEEIDDSSVFPEEDQSNKETNAEETEEHRSDWDWKGNKAVELDNAGETHDSEEEEEEESDGGSEVEDNEKQSWTLLDEEIQSTIMEKENAEKEGDFWKANENEYYNKAAETEVDLWKSNEDNERLDEEEVEDLLEQEEIEDFLEQKECFKTDTPFSTNSQGSMRDIRLDIVDKPEHEEGVEEPVLAEELEDKLAKDEEGITGEAQTDGESRLEGSDEPSEGEPRLKTEAEGTEGEPHEEETRLDAEAEVPEGEPCLGGDVEGEPRVDGDQLTGGQSPMLDCEVQPAEPPPPQEPEHTEEDLWEYLRETVTSVHPSTVEEFVQNLIGTLQHVPPEYLHPVIEANIKRATSPSVTDGEHLASPEGVALEGGERLPAEGLAPEDDVLTLTIPESGPAPSSEGDTILPSEETPSNVQVEQRPSEAESADSTEGFSTLEAAA